MKSYSLIFLLLCVLSAVQAQERLPVSPDRIPLTPENVSALLPLNSWGDGHLRDIGWTDEGSLRIVTDDEVRLYDPDSLEQPIRVEKSLPEGVKSPDGRLFFVDEGLDIVLKDFETGETLSTLRGYPGMFDPTGRYLAFRKVETETDQGREFYVYDLSDPRQPQKLQTFTDMGAMLFFKDHWLFSWDDRVIYALDIETGSVTRIEPDMTSESQNHGFKESWPSPDKKFLATIYSGVPQSSDQSARMLLIYNIDDPASPVLVYEETLENEFTPIAWSPDSQTLMLSWNGRQRAYVHERNDFRLDWAFEEFTMTDVLKIAYSPDSSLLVLNSEELGMERYGLRLYRDHEPIAFQQYGRVVKLAISPDNKTLAIMADDTTVGLVSTETLEEVGTLKLQVFDRFVLSADGSVIYGQDKTLDPFNGGTMNRSGRDDDFSQDRTLIAIYDHWSQYASRFYVRDLVTGEDIQIIEGTDLFNHAEAPRISPDNRLLAIFALKASNEDQDRMLLFDIASGDLLDDVEFDMASGQYLMGEAVFSSDSKILVWTTMSGREFAVYNVETREKKMFPIQDYVLSLAVNDGSLVFAATYRDGMKVWDTATGESIPVPALEAAGPMKYIVLSSDGTRLYTSNYYGRLTIWGLSQ